jgi:hypothetical protein
VTVIMCDVTTRVNDARVSTRRVLVLLNRILKPELESTCVTTKKTEIAGPQVEYRGIITDMVHMRHKAIESSWALPIPKRGWMLQQSLY